MQRRSGPCQEPERSIVAFHRFREGKIELAFMPDRSVFRRMEERIDMHAVFSYLDCDHS